LNKFISILFYGNIFLGICAAALCIETNLLTGITLNVFPFYLLIFFCTCIYYTNIYVRSVSVKNYNERALWYKNNLTTIRKTLTVAILLVIIFLLFFVLKNWYALLSLSSTQMLLVITLPFIAFWYTFSPAVFRLKKIRQTGWIKPFAVGFTWAGWVTVYPVVISKVQTGRPIVTIISACILLWLQNFLFFSINAIIFDIKDYRTDSHYQLKTYPVIFGIKNTFRFIIIPLILVNLIIFTLFQLQQNFSFLQTLIQLIPYMFLVFIIAKYRQGRSVLYYLAAVDGLVFLKAVCGIASILLIKK
jgi:4-hydroxybenzoate polyprenyltransferase